MMHVELLGASGVGKSTLVQQMVGHKAVPQGWVDRSTARLALARDVTRNSSGLLQYLQRASLLMPSWPSKARYTERIRSRVASRVLQEYEALAEKTIVPQYEVLFELMFRRLQKPDAAPRHIAARYVEFLHRILLQDYALPELLRCPYHIIHDEGVLHNAGGLLCVGEVDDATQELSRLLKKKCFAGVILCSLPVGEIVRRQESRSVGAVSYLGIEYSGKSLVGRTERGICSSAEKARLLSGMGIPLLEIDMLMPISQNVDRVAAFIAELRPDCSETKAGYSADTNRLS